MKPSDPLKLHRNARRSMIRRFGLPKPRAFGSVLTLTDGEDSELDLQVDRGEKTSLLTLVGAEQDTQRLTRVRVSV